MKFREFLENRDEQVRQIESLLNYLYYTHNLSPEEIQEMPNHELALIIAKSGRSQNNENQLAAMVKQFSNTQ